MIFIELQQLRFHAFHGLYEGEKKTGGPFEVNVKVGYEERISSFDRLDDTINYEEIFSIVKQQMQVATPLLEKVGQNILNKIKQRFPFTKEVTVSIYKLEAPLQTFEGRVGITIEKKF